MRPPIPKPSTIDEVAALAGVSVATVSRALRGLPNVAPATRERVSLAAAELRYRADANASALASGRSRLVALAMPVQHSWYFAQIVAGAEAAIRESGYDLLVYSVQSEAQRRRFLTEQAPFRNRVDGLIVIDLSLPVDEASAVEATGVSVVTVGFETGRFDSVVIDDRRASRELVTHLLRRGHRRIGVIAGGATELRFTVPGERLAGYRDALKGFGITFEPELVQRGDFTLDGAAAATHRLLDADRPPTAIFAMSDEMAYAGMDVARTRGLRVPEDLSFAGFDGHELSSMFGLTTVHQPVAEIGGAAARQLIRRMERPSSPPRHHPIDTTLRVRRSVSNLT
jgi:LacI family transcriptional regulator, repressor for deo operon, udp, cdd, tsx, nupC, and nupG